MSDYRCKHYATETDLVVLLLVRLFVEGRIPTFVAFDKLTALHVNYNLTVCN